MMGFLTRKIGGAAACGWKIFLSCSTRISTEKLNLDRLSYSCARCICTGVIFMTLKFSFFAQLCSCLPFL